MQNRGDFAEIQAWIKVLYSKQQKEAKEAQKLIDEHFFDAESVRQKPQYIECPKDRLQWIKNEKHRAIFILFKSGCLSNDAIGRATNTHPNNINRIIQRYKTAA